jgi:hypothetical protein
LLLEVLTCFYEINHVDVSLHYRDLVTAQRKPPMTLKMVSESTCGLENSSESRCLWQASLLSFFLYPVRDEHWIKSTDDRRPKQNYEAPFGTIFRISKMSCFHRSKPKSLYIYISFLNSSLQNRKRRFIPFDLQKGTYSSHDPVPLKVHKIEIVFGFDFEICIISLLVMSEY